MGLYTHISSDNGFILSNHSTTPGKFPPLQKNVLTVAAILECTKVEEPNTARPCWTLSRFVFILFFLLPTT